LHEVAKWGHLKVVKLLIIYGADINAAGIDGRKPIHMAIARGNMNVVTFLKNHGADL
jgi:serine/threonine-protein kinase TNNI3K